MSDETKHAIDELLPRLAPWGDADEWERDDDEDAVYHLRRECDPADGPSWRLTHSHGTWTVEREDGWYLQCAEVSCAPGVAQMLRAMDAAAAALGAALWPAQAD